MVPASPTPPAQVQPQKNKSEQPQKQPQSTPNGTEQNADTNGKSSQSYLALTKLGMGKKEENNNKKQPQNGTTDQVTKNGSKNGNEGGKRKSMAEMASNTLKGFAKM